METVILDYLRRLLLKRAFRGTLAARRRPTSKLRAFTIVEMIVVIAVIALILAIGVPAFNSMTVQQRISKTRQLLNGTLTRTQVIAVSDQTLTAVRICPADWHLDASAAAGTSKGRQIITTYSYRHTYAANPNYPLRVRFAERFERIEDGPTHLLPPDTWVAPSEAFDLTRMVRDGESSSTDWLGNLVLKGQIGAFRFDAANKTDDFLEADDFLIVFDPETGVQPSARGYERPIWRLRALDPRPLEDGGQIETDALRRANGTVQVAFRRYNFTGTVIYRREPFVAMGTDLTDADGVDARRDVLKRFGQTYYVNRTGGNLVDGAGE